MPYGPQTLLRVTIGEGYYRPVYLHVFADHYRSPWYGHYAIGRGGIDAALAPPADRQMLRSGDVTPWCNLTPTVYQDSGAALNLSVRHAYHEKAARLRAKLEFGRYAETIHAQNSGALATGPHGAPGTPGAPHIEVVKTFDIEAQPTGEPAARGGAHEPAKPRTRAYRLRDVLRETFAARSATFIYVGAGLQTLTLGALAAWIPSFLAREYGLAAGEAGLRGALIMLGAAVGMIAGGWIADRVARQKPRRRLQATAVYTSSSFVVLTAAFTLPPGAPQLALLLLGSTLAAAHVGVVPTLVVDVTNPGLRATALGTVVLINNLLGLAPGPLLVGLLSDATSLKTALAGVPLVGAGAAICLLQAARSYESDRAARAARGPDG